MNDYLYHDGVKGRSGRYPWGSGDRPYQRLEGSRGGFFARRKEKKAVKKQLAQLESARERARDKATYEANKEKALKGGTASEILIYQGDLTNQQLETAINRLRLEKTLKEYSANEIKTNFQIIDDIVSKVDKVSGWANTGMKIYDQFAKVYNTTEEGQKNPKKLLNPNPQGGEKKKKRKQ